MKSITLISIVLLLVCLADAQAPPARRIIDAHMHALPPDVFGQSGLPNPVTGKPSAAQTTVEIRDSTLQAMKKHGIVKAVLSGPLDVVAQWTEVSADDFLASPMFPHFAPFPDLEMLRERYKGGQLQAMAEIVAQYAGLKPGDLELEPYLALAEELDIPVGLHMGPSAPGISYSLAPKYRAADGNPLLLEEALVRHPKLRVYIMHAGWPFIDEAIAVLWAHPQVYVDVAVIDWLLPRAEFHRYLKRLVDAGFAERIMFGSDQMVWPEAIELAIEGVESAEFLSDREKEDIFYNNAARFFRVTEESSN
jgi:predicted TIM-barrel fold metal-dependent hydrolase